MLTRMKPYDVPVASDASFNYIYNGRLPELLRHYGKVVHPDAVDLVQHMVCTPRRRYTVEQVLAHRWLTA